MKDILLGIVSNSSIAKPPTYGTHDAALISAIKTLSVQGYSVYFEPLAAGSSLSYLYIKGSPNGPSLKPH